ncbi:MAG: exodeoxyribonuclease VII large subunit, partial [Steroidobacteraceae bacterium]
RELRTLGTRLDSTLARLKLAHPRVRIEQHAQRLDDLEQRLIGAARGRVHRERLRVSEAFARLLAQSPQHRVRDCRMRQAALTARLERAVAERLAQASHRLGLAQRALHAVSPLATLTRGFAIVTRAADGSLLTDADGVELGEEIEARLAHGRVRARITGKDAG